MKQILWVGIFLAELLFCLLRNKKPFSDTVQHLNWPDDNSHWGNLGYWPNHKKIEPGQQQGSAQYPLAARQLASQLITNLPLQNIETVLVLGCGAGEEVSYLSEQLLINREQNSENSQVPIVSMEGWDLDHTALNVAQAKMPHQQWKHQSAECLLEIKYQRRFDFIYALDCAYHFKSRQCIWCYAYDALTSGGILAVSDLCLHPDTDKFLSWKHKGWLRFASIMFSIPRENWLLQSDYIAEFKNMGFEVLGQQECGQQVLDGFVQFTQGEQFNRTLPKSWQLKSLITAWLIKQLRRRQLISYFIVQLKKP